MGFLNLRCGFDSCRGHHQLMTTDYRLLVNRLKSLDWKFIITRTISNALILGAIVYFLSAFWDIGKQELLFVLRDLRGQEFTVDEVEESEEPEEESPFATLVKQPTPLKLTPKSKQFGILIEKIKVNAPVIENVSVADKRTYLHALEKGVAHARGTAKPGQIGNAYLFAHSSLDFWNYGPYSGVFNLLRKLEKGDRIVVFYKGGRFDYYVTRKEVVSGFNTNPLTQTFATPHLTLQTCNPPGVAVNRLIITAELRSN